MSPNPIDPIDKRYSSILRFALPIFSFLTFLRFYVNSPGVANIAAATMVLYGITLLAILLPKSSTELITLGYLLIMLAGASLVVIFGPNETYVVVPQFLGNVGFAFAIYHQRLRVKTYEWMFYAYILLFLGYIIKGTDPADVFTVSRNFISVFLILNLGFYYIACYQNNVVPRLAVAGLGFIVALWAIGRAGIASLIAIFLYTVFFTKQRLRVRIATVIVAALAGIAFFSFENASDSLFTVGIERFQRLGVEDVRDSINSAYQETATRDFGSLIFGARLDSVPEIVAVDGNPHNSYIGLHKNFGLIGFVATMLCFLFSAIAIIQRKEFLLLMLFLIVLFRVSVDSAAFYGPLDLLLMFFVFTSFSKLRITSDCGNLKR